MQRSIPGARSPRRRRGTPDRAQAGATSPGAPLTPPRVSLTAFFPSAVVVGFSRRKKRFWPSDPSVPHTPPDPFLLRLLRRELEVEVDKYRQIVVSTRPRRPTDHDPDLGARVSRGNRPVHAGIVRGVPPPAWTTTSHYDLVSGGTDHGVQTAEQMREERRLARGAYLNPSVVTGPAMLARVTRETEKAFGPGDGRRGVGKTAPRGRKPRRERPAWGRPGTALKETRENLARPDVAQLRDGNGPWKWNLGLSLIHI